MLVASDAKIWHFFEERCAAFFALGRSRATGTPVAVVTTSGTAAAELFPAIIEAHYQGVPLLAITADRPRNFRGSGAPQAIEQLRLFGDYPSSQVDVETANEAEGCLESWKLNGPAHLNVCLDEPAEFHACSLQSFSSFSPLSAITKLSLKLNKDGLLVLLGDLLPSEQEAVKMLLKNFTGQVWAEAASGLRGWLGDRLFAGGEALLSKQHFNKLLRLGGVPSCRLWRDLETMPHVDVISLSRTGHSGLARNSTSHTWFEATIELQGEAAACPATSQNVTKLPAKFPASECGHLQHLAKRIPATASLFLGNSLAIREWNLAVPPHPAESNCHVLRGANGIDGNLSFFYGMGVGKEESWAIVGDLTAMYDLAAPWILQQLPAARRRLVIMNNGGGKIFRRLPSLRSMNAAEQQIIENPHSTQFSHWAAMWGMDYVKIESVDDWEQSLPDGDVVIEIIPSEAESEAFWAALAKASTTSP